MCKALGTAPGVSACSASTNFKDPSSFGSLSVLVTPCLRHLLQEAFPDCRDACSILLFVVITPPPTHFHFNCLILASHSRTDRMGDESGVSTPRSSQTVLLTVFRKHLLGERTDQKGNLIKIARYRRPRRVMARYIPQQCHGVSWGSSPGF